MTKHPDLFAALAAPFESNEVRVRDGSRGAKLHYITARVAMNRFDNVVGPENWWDHFTETKDGLMCEITVRLPDGSAVTKGDGGGAAGMPESDNDEKSAFSDAFKRAAVKWGVGRYLYRDGVPVYAQGLVANEPARHPEPDRQPSQARPAPTSQELPEQFRRPGGVPAHQANGHGEQRQYDDRPPTTGKALFAKLKDMGQKADVDLVRHVNGWAKLQEFPARLVDFDRNQVDLAYAEATRKLAAVGASDREPGSDG